MVDNFNGGNKNKQTRQELVNELKLFQGSQINATQRGDESIKKVLINELKAFDTQRPLKFTEASEFGEKVEIQKPESKGFWTQLKEAFTGADRETEETKNLPEIGEADTGEGLKVLGALFAATRPEEQANILENNIEGLTQRTDKKGNIIVKFPNGSEAVLNKPGLTISDARQILFEAVQFLPASKLANFGKTILGKIGLGGLLAGGTQATKELAQEQLGGEFDTGEVLFATGAGAGGEAIGGLLKNRQFKKQAKNLNVEKEFIDETAEAVKEAQKASKSTGVELFEAQKTLSPSRLEEQSFIATLPSAQRTSFNALKKQNKQAGDAVEEFLNSVAKAEAVEAGAETFKAAAQKAIEAQKVIRKEKTSTLYNIAFEENPPTNLNPVRELINNKLKEFPETGEISKALRKAKSLISGELPSLKKLEGAKLELDQMLSKAGKESLGNVTKKQIIDVKNELLKQMDDASPTYRQARRLFASLSPAIEELEKSILGKIAKLDDTQLKTISRKIFDPENLNVQTMLKTKKIINSVDQNAWNDLLRVELERRLGSMKPDALKGAGKTVENLPNQLKRAIFGNEKQARILKNAVSGEMRKNLNYLETALERASLGRIGGSQTATRTEIMERLRRGLFSAISELFTPFEGAKKGVIGTTFDKNVKKLASALFDSKWEPQLSKIRKINPNSPEAARLLTQLLNNIDKENEEVR